MTTLLLSIAMLVMLGLIGYLWRRNRQMYRAIDVMLDEVLDDERITELDICEGEISALAAKVKRVQEKVEFSVSEAEKEKEAVKQLISNLSHQVKTPLSVLVMYQEMLNDESLDVETRKIFVAKMKKQVEKLEWILGALFKMVELEQNAVVFDAKPLPLRQTVIDAAGAVMDKIAAKDQSLNILPFDDVLVWHNRRWTIEVFINLLENAIKYTPQGGKITIYVQMMELYTKISVSDTGCGIREDEKNTIFQRFYRGKDAEHIEGSGLGLALSRLILSREKGYITVESKYGEGSTFSVFLQNCHNNDVDLS
ncbi:MAG: HAMP domain-containing sensor histidine kinase [Peptococcaceae bacterium]|nr:HAMP domain-containing sensor histidine kinase [Peptococcaceae bacterium]